MQTVKKFRAALTSSLDVYRPLYQWLSATELQICTILMRIILCRDMT